MKKTKKLISAMLSACMLVGVFSVGNSAYAAEFENSKLVSNEIFFFDEQDYTQEEIHDKISSSKNSVTYNEFDRLIEMKEEAISIINSADATTEQRATAKHIAEIDPSDRVYELQALSDEQLAKNGFSNERIQIIRNFSGSTAELYGLGANCTVSLEDEAYSIVQSEQRWAKATVYFEWDEPPFWNYNDVLVLGASSTFYPQETSGTKCKIYYSANGVAGSNDFSETYNKNDMEISPFDVNNAGFAFPVAIEEVLSDGTYYNYYSMSGYATIGFMSVDDRQVILSGAHGHAKKNVSLSVGIDFVSGGLSAGISIDDTTYSIEADTLSAYTFSS